MNLSEDLTYNDEFLNPTKHLSTSTPLKGQTLNWAESDSDASWQSTPSKVARTVNFQDIDSSSNLSSNSGFSDRAPVSVFLYESTSTENDESVLEGMPDYSGHECIADTSNEEDGILNHDESDDYGTNDVDTLVNLSRTSDEQDGSVIDDGLFDMTKDNTVTSTNHSSNTQAEKI
ncbi:hypothetical protein AC249_AIPGENE16803 [Exaiptasia diaphana]|nr:hypothetical protein AC249_AIPGENE16803 [Exaiptasia diaphana]